MYSTKRDAASTDRELVVIPIAGGQALVSLARCAMASGDGTSTTQARAFLQICNSATSSTTIDEFNTRSATSTTVGATHGQLLNGNPMVWTTIGMFGLFSGQWRPPRPWAVARVEKLGVSGGQISHANQTTASSPSQGWWTGWDDSERLESHSTRIRSRRGRRRGLLSYRTENTHRNQAITGSPGRPVDNKWVCYVKESPQRGQPSPSSLLNSGPTSITDSDSATLTEQTPVISLQSTDTATLSSSQSVATSGVTAKSDSDSATLTDSVVGANPSDVEVAILSETQSITSLTSTAITSSDSATLTDSGVVTVPVLPTSSDLATLSETNSVTTLTNSFYNDSDSAVLTETWTLVATLSPTDTFTFTETSANITSKPSQCYIRSRY